MKLNRIHVLTTPCSLNADRTIGSAIDTQDNLHAVTYCSGRVVGVVEDSGNRGSQRWLYAHVRAGKVGRMSSIWGPSRHACLLKAERLGAI